MNQSAKIYHWKMFMSTYLEIFAIRYQSSLAIFVDIHRDVFHFFWKVVCRQLGLSFVQASLQTDVFRGNRTSQPKHVLSGIACRGNEESLDECSHDPTNFCPGINPIKFKVQYMRPWLISVLLLAVSTIRGLENKRKPQITKGKQLYYVKFHCGCLVFGYCYFYLPKKWYFLYTIPHFLISLSVRVNPLCCYKRSSLRF